MTEWYQYPAWDNFRDSYAGMPYPVNGEDIAVPYNTPITALFAGTVARQYYDESGGIVMIKADNPSDLYGIPYYYYAHLDSTPLVPGSHVVPGQEVGLSGGQLTGGLHPASPATSTGPHIMIGESKTASIPYTLDALTPDLNPNWMIDYARSGKVKKQTGTTPSPGTQPCSPPDTLVSISSEQYCKHDNGNGTFSYKSVGGVNNPDVIGSFLQSVQNIIPWLSSPVRVIKALSGIMLIGCSIFLIASPSSGIAQGIIKGVGKVGIH